MSVRHRYVLVPATKMAGSILRLLVEEGFIENYDVTKDQPQAMIRVWLKYTAKKQPLISGVQRVSKPGRRVYAQKDNIPWVKSGMGFAVLSTSKGVMTDRQARSLGVGGEIVCRVW
jgi:small subunit ribosomal protein S8